MSDQRMELLELIKNSPVGTYKLFRATEKDPDIERSFQNKNELSKRIETARSNGCFIEVISLRMQYMDLWLRVYFENIPNDCVREREFGRLLRQCFDLGLDKTLYDSISKFNKQRVNSVHGYLLGKVLYSELLAVVEESDGLSERLAQFVVINSGETVTESFFSERHEVGDTVYCVPDLIEHLLSRNYI